mgnify:CR=1 FL=1
MSAEDDDALSPANLIKQLQEAAAAEAKIAEEKYQDTQNVRNSLIATINTSETLTKLFRDYTRDTKIVPGSVVRWKEGFRNRSVSGPFVVIEKLARADCPRVGVDNSVDDVNVANPLFMEPVDVRVAFIAPEDGDQNTLMYWLDSYRLERVSLYGDVRLCAGPVQTGRARTQHYLVSDQVSGMLALPLHSG